MSSHTEKWRPLVSAHKTSEHRIMLQHSTIPNLEHIRTFCLIDESDNSEVIWVGSKRIVSMHARPAIRTGNNTMSVTDNAHLLGVLISPDMTFDQHVTIVSGQCFYQLCQLHSVRQSLDTESTMTLICAFVWSRMDYCCSLLIGSPRSATDKLQHVLNAAAHVITISSKYYSGLLQILHHDLHWLDVTERIQFRVATTVYQCLHGMAAAWLNCVYPSLRQQDVVVGFGPPQPATWSHHASDCQPTAPMPLVSLVQSAGTHLKSSDLSFNCFRQQLKTFLCCKYWHQCQHYFSALETLLMRSTNARYLTYTYLLFHSYSRFTWQKFCELLEQNLLRPGTVPVIQSTHHSANLECVYNSLENSLNACKLFLVLNQVNAE